MFSFTRRQLVLTATSAALVATVALGSALAAVHVQSSTRIPGRQIDLVKAVSGIAFDDQAQAEWVDVPGAAVNVTVSSSTAAFVLIRFAGAARCDDAHSHGQFCGVRATVDGVEVEPGAVSFTSLSDGTFGDPADTKAMEWSTAELASGTHRVQIQAFFDIPLGFHLDRWHLTVERVRM